MYWLAPITIHIISKIYINICKIKPMLIDQFLIAGSVWKGLYVLKLFINYSILFLYLTIRHTKNIRISHPCILFFFDSFRNFVYFLIYRPGRHVLFHQFRFVKLDILVAFLFEGTISDNIGCTIFIINYGDGKDGT